MSKKGNKSVKVFLMEDVKDLGRSGEVVSVAFGYARNYLIPARIATKPSADAMRVLHKRKDKEVAELQRKGEVMQALADLIPKTNVTLEMKVSADGKLYGAITPALVAKAMQDAGLGITAQHVRLETPIKEIGQFDIPIHVFGDVVVNARIWVVSVPE